MVLAQKLLLPVTFPKRFAFRCEIRTGCCPYVLKKLEDIAFCELTNKDVVRHPLVQKIVQAYDAYEKKEANEKKRKEASQRQEERTMTLNLEMEYEKIWILITKSLQKK